MQPEPQPLERGFFLRPAWQVAPDLIGCQILREVDGRRARVMITETEAYQGMEDQACHARSGKSARNAVMFGPPGHAYVYFTYGMHWMLNVVCEEEGYPAAVLIRAVQALESQEVLRERRPKLAGTDGWLNGPAKLTQALGINRSHNGVDLTQVGARFFLAKGTHFGPEDMLTGPRVGLGATPEPWLSMPWRWRLKPTALQAALQTL